MSDGWFLLIAGIVVLAIFVVTLCRSAATYSDSDDEQMRWLAEREQRPVSQLRRRQLDRICTRDRVKR